MRCSPGVPEGERQSGSIQKDFTFKVLLDACRCRALKRILTQLSFPYSHTIMRMNSKCLNLFLVLGLAACASSGTPVAPEPVAPAEVAPGPAAAPSSALGFTSAQADRGRDVFRSACTTCHYSEEFSDQTFKRSWRRSSAGDLYDFISTAMPEDAPGSLPPAQYAEIVAYFLQMNGFEAGSMELPADADALSELSLAPLGG